MNDLINKVAGKQYYKCANKPGLTLIGLENYECPLWKINGINQGSFDEACYKISYNDKDILQALCKMCHSVKKKRFLMRDKSIVIDEDIDEDSVSNGSFLSKRSMRSTCDLATRAECSMRSTCENWNAVPTFSEPRVTLPSAKLSRTCDLATRSDFPDISSDLYPVYQYSEIDFTNTNVSELITDVPEPFAYISYNNSTINAETKIFVQSGKIKLTSYRIPPLNHDLNELFTVFLDPKQSACMELRKHLEAADAWANSHEMRRKLFGKRADKYLYESLRLQYHYNDGDDDDDGDGEEHSTKSVHMEFNMLVEGDKRINKTKLIKVKGMHKTLVKADTIAEIANEIQYWSEIRFIFYFNKIWAHKERRCGATKIPYGIQLKIMAIEYTNYTN